MTAVVADGGLPDCSSLAAPSWGMSLTSASVIPTLPLCPVDALAIGMLSVKLRSPTDLPSVTALSSRHCSGR